MVALTLDTGDRDVRGRVRAGTRYAEKVAYARLARGPHRVGRHLDHAGVGRGDDHGGMDPFECGRQAGGFEKIEGAAFGARHRGPACGARPDGKTG